MKYVRNQKIKEILGHILNVQRDTKPSNTYARHFRILEQIDISLPTWQLRVSRQEGRI